MMVDNHYLVWHAIAIHLKHISNRQIKNRTFRGDSLSNEIFDFWSDDLKFAIIYMILLKSLKLK